MAPRFSSPDDNLNQLFADLATFAAPGGTLAQFAQKAATLTGFFCPQSAGPPEIPAIGITNHGLQANQPYFKGVTEVTNLWLWFYKCFDSFTFAPTTLEMPGGNAPAPRFQATVAAGGTQIPMRAVQCDLSGTYQLQWHPPNHDSPPLSTIPIPTSGHLSTHIAATAVFAFDANNLITRMWVYMDRYKLQTDLRPGSTAVLVGFSKGFEEWTKAVAETSKKEQ
jgi:hypothetical protein